MIPYGRQYIDKQDEQAVLDVLRSGWLTTGPAVEAFEAAVCAFCAADYGVAVSSGTAALHCAMHALGIEDGDEVIVPPMTFVATANAVLYQNGTPVFVDVDAETLLLDPQKVQEAITSRTKAIIGVDYTGQPCDWDALREIAQKHGLALIADGCHAIGGTDKGRSVGTLADMTVFSFHPVKHVATGEGGMVVSSNANLIDRVRLFRNHGITTDHRQREKSGSWKYEMVDLGYNYRITDIQCALGKSQMDKLEGFLRRRRNIATMYDHAFEDAPGIIPLGKRADAESAYHLYVVFVEERERVYERMRAAGIGVNVHYSPVHLHPYYQKRFGYGPGLCPVAEAAAERLLSIPMFPSMTDDDVRTVIHVINEAVEG